MNPHSQSSNTFKFLHIQTLRGISALLVILFHSNALTINYGQEPSWAKILLGSFGEAGVDIFFVISGFIIATVTPLGSGIKEFLIKRAIRVVPLYWCVTLFYLSIYFLLPQAFNTFHAELYHVVSSFLFIPSAGPDGQVVPVVSYGWSLNFEVLFYILFSFFLPFTTWQRVLGVIGGFVFIFILALFSEVFPAKWATALNFYNNSMVIEFVVGMILGTLYIEKVKITRYLPLLSLTILAIYFFLKFSMDGMSDIRFVRYGLPAISIFSIFLYLDLTQKVKPILVRLGDISYSLYLVQAFTLPILWKLLMRLGIMQRMNVNLIVLVSIAFTIFVAELTYRFIEKKSQRQLNRFFR